MNTKIRFFSTLFIFLSAFSGLFAKEAKEKANIGSISSDQYGDCLNTLASSDPYHLFEESGGSICRMGVPGSYEYHVLAPGETIPMISWLEGEWYWNMNHECSFDNEELLLQGDLFPSTSNPSNQAPSLVAATFQDPTGQPAPTSECDKCCIDPLLHTTAFTFLTSNSVMTFSNNDTTNHATKETPAPSLWDTIVGGMMMVPFTGGGYRRNAQQNSEYHAILERGVKEYYTIEENPEHYREADALWAEAAHHWEERRKAREEQETLKQRVLDARAVIEQEELTRSNTDPNQTWLGRFAGIANCAAGVLQQLAPIADPITVGYASLTTTSVATAADRANTHFHNAPVQQATEEEVKAREEATKAGVYVQKIHDNAVELHHQADIQENQSREDERTRILNKVQALQLPGANSQQGDSPEAWRAWVSRILPQEAEDKRHAIATYASENPILLEQLLTQIWEKEIEQIEKKKEALKQNEKAQKLQGDYQVYERMMQRICNYRAEKEGLEKKQVENSQQEEKEKERVKTLSTDLDELEHCIQENLSATTLSLQELEELEKKQHDKRSALAEAATRLKDQCSTLEQCEKNDSVKIKEIETEVSRCELEAADLIYSIGGLKLVSTRERERVENLLKEVQKARLELVRKVVDHQARLVVKRQEEAARLEAVRQTREEAVRKVREEEKLQRQKDKDERTNNWLKKQHLIGEGTEKNKKLTMDGNDLERHAVALQQWKIAEEEANTVKKQIANKKENIQIINAVVGDYTRTAEEEAKDAKLAYNPKAEETLRDLSEAKKAGYKQALIENYSPDFGKEGAKKIIERAEEDTVADITRSKNEQSVISLEQTLRQQNKERIEQSCDDNSVLKELIKNPEEGYLLQEKNQEKVFEELQIVTQDNKKLSEDIPNVQAQLKRKTEELREQRKNDRYFPIINYMPFASRLVPYVWTKTNNHKKVESDIEYYKQIISKKNNQNHDALIRKNLLEGVCTQVNQFKKAEAEKEKTDNNLKQETESRLKKENELLQEKNNNLKKTETQLSDLGYEGIDVNNGFSAEDVEKISGKLSSEKEKTIEEKNKICHQVASEFNGDLVEARVMLGPPIVHNLYNRGVDLYNYCGRGRGWKEAEKIARSKEKQDLYDGVISIVATDHQRQQAEEEENHEDDSSESEVKHRRSSLKAMYNTVVPYFPYISKDYQEWEE